MVVTALIFDTPTLRNGLRDLDVGFPPILGGGSDGTVEFGQNLHVALVEAVPQQGEFPAGRILGYDLRFELKHSSAPFTWLSRTNPELAYAPYVVPTFHLPEPSHFVPSLLHCSCRKLHGPGSDALGLIDDILRQNRELPGRRPHAVIHTGDQIYADDVADGLSAYIAELAKRLLGSAESLPFLDRARLLSEIDEAHARWLIPRFYLTPDDKRDRNKSAGRNQLLGFSEFAAMYLLAWSEENWPDAILSKELEATRSALTKVRRALANIASYMLLDDHEVTDDWNLNRRWQMTVNSSPTPKRVIANGVAAYWVFQAWGNDPRTFVPRGLNDVITAHLQRERQVEKHREYGRPSDPVGTRYDAALLSAHWDFVAPTQPPAVFIDSRTQRAFPPANASGGLGAPAALLNDAGLKTLDQELRDLNVGGKTVILVAATPVFGIPAIEEAMALAVRKGLSPERADFENWHANGDGFLSLLTQIHRHRPATCIFLSGDVHYAFGIRAFFRAGGYATPFVQFTSSALKNEPTGYQRGFLEALGDLLKAGEWQFETPPPPHFEDNGDRGSVFSRMLSLTDKMYFWLQSNLGMLSVEPTTAKLTFYAGDGGKHTRASVTLSVALGEIPG